jgi:hypothetical protein
MVGPTSESIHEINDGQPNFINNYVVLFIGLHII